MASSQTSASGISPQAAALHARSIVIDTHCDTTQRLLGKKFNFGGRNPDGHLDLPRLREGGVGAVFLAIWLRGTVTGQTAVGRALEQINLIRAQVTMHPAELVLARTAKDIRDAHAASKIAILMGVEGGHIINDRLSVLRNYAQLGVRYLTLTHVLNNNWADSSTDVPVHNGLSDFGKQVIRELNHLGMMVDISHVSDKAFYDVLDVSEVAPIATHSCCKALCDAPRNMTDDMIRALAARGGVMQINFHVSFLSQQFRDAEKAQPELNQQIDARLAERCGDDVSERLVVGDQAVREFVAAGKLPRVEWARIIDHIDHAVSVAGIDHVGLGSDFDGADMPYGMDDASYFPRITDALLNKGYAQSDVQKILGGNTLRLMEDVEAAAQPKIQDKI